MTPYTCCCEVQYTLKIVFNLEKFVYEAQMNFTFILNDVRASSSNNSRSFNAYLEQPGMSNSLFVAPPSLAYNWVV